MANALLFCMQEQQTQPGAESPPRSDQSSSSSPSAHPQLGKLLSFARRHRALSVMSAAGAGLIAGPEIALGIVLGAGVTMLIDRSGRSGLRMEQEAAEAARSVRQRARHLFDAETVKLRARAVLQAARGQIQPAAPPIGESQKQSASEVVATSTM